jgi:trimethylamine--corrinoid protein Co-methyltransferase
LAGANLIYGLGMIEMGMTIDYGQLVMDNEFAKMIKHAVRGIPVNDETLAVGVMREIGIGRDYLSHEHTHKHMHSQSQSRLIDRRTRESWEARGGTDIFQRAMEEARYILEHHQPDPIADSALAEMRWIVEEAEKELGIAK